jgi:YesN/AraC family two-component response regulator
VKKEDLEKATAIKEFLEKNYQETFDYAFLTKKFGMNMFNLKQAFKAVTNDNIHAYLTKIRVKRAKKLLETTDLNVGFIASQVGLDRSNFYIQFKKITGKSPSEWRKDPTPDYTNSNHAPFSN